MNKRMSFSGLSDELAQVRTKKKEFLTQMDRIIPWKEWLTLIQPCYYKGERGNKPYPLETMLRLYLLQNLYDLSDEATAAEAIDSRIGVVKAIAADPSGHGPLPPCSVLSCLVHVYEDRPGNSPAAPRQP